MPRTHSKKRKKINWENHWEIKFRDLRGMFSDIWQNIPEFFGKIFMRVEKTVSCLPKNLLEKRETFCRKKSASMKLSDLGKISVFLSEHFSAVLLEEYAFFGANFELDFFVKNLFLFSFHQTVLGPSKNYFLQWCQNFILYVRRK